MNRWTQGTLGSLVMKLVDGSHNPPPRQADGLPMLSAQNISDDCIRFDGYRPISKDAFKREDRRTKVQSGDILLTIVGSIGRSAVVPERCKPFTLQRSVAVLSSSAVLPRFLCYQLRSPRIQKYLRDNARGTAQKGVYLNCLSQIPVLIAPSNEQKRIVSKIDELFSRIEEGERALERVQRLVERYRQSVLKAAVTGELTREWREKHKGKLEFGEVLLARILKARRAAWEKSELGKMKAKGQKPANDHWKRKYKEPVPPDTSDLPDLPDGWVWASLDQVSNRVTDGTHQPPPFASQGVPFLTIQHLSPGRIHWDGIEKWVTHNIFLEYTKSMRPMCGDVLYSAVGSYGIAVAVKTSKDFMFQRHIAHIRPIREYLEAAFLEAVLNSPLSMSRANSVARGVAQKTVTLGDLREFPIPVTSLAEQQAILDQLDQAESSIAELTDEMRLQQTSASLRQAILKAAFSGDLVPHFPTDEPASILLERIAAERNGKSAKKAARKRRKREMVTA